MLIIELTEYYCSLCKKWHRKGDKDFNHCLKRYDANQSIKVEEVK